MPCRDGREQEDQERTKRRQDAMTAILCGVMQSDKRALEFAAEWCGHHAEADGLRKGVKYDWQDKRILEALAKCDAVCERAYQALCMP